MSDAERRGKGTIIPRIEARADTRAAQAVSHAYDSDLVLWAENQAYALRNAARVVPELAIDWENVADEIEALSRSERRKLVSLIRTLIEHLAKLEASPAIDPRAGWRETVRHSRLEISDVLQDSPSLNAQLEDIVVNETLRVQELVARTLSDYNETPRIPLNKVAFSIMDILDPYWFPGRPKR